MGKIGIILEKEKALDNFVDLISQSWTYEKLTKEEQKKFKEFVYSKQVENCLRGNHNQRVEILQAIYSGFLVALNYKPIGWRDKDEEDLLF